MRTDEQSETAIYAYNIVCKRTRKMSGSGLRNVIINYGAGVNRKLRTVQ